MRGRSLSSRRGQILPRQREPPPTGKV